MQEMARRQVELEKQLTELGRTVETALAEQRASRWQVLRPLHWLDRLAGRVGRRIMNAAASVLSPRARRQRKAWQAAEQQVRQSGLFDAAFYLRNSPDVAQCGLDPLQHFVRYGAAEGRDPGPSFDTQYYLQNNPDVAASGASPLLHYIQYGAAEGRAPRAAAGAGGENDGRGAP
jgi:hypothetical protein